MANKPVILCVDDDQNVVESMKLNLRRHYEVLTALSGPQGLEILRDQPDVAVVVSDMRMPEMDGAAFLAKVKTIAPSAVRMLLTGYSDIEAAMRAVNEGQIFRFLTKPCSPEHLLATLAAGVEQHRLITAERVLLQKTLLGSVKAVVEVLALGNPMALGRAVRIRDTARDIAIRLNVDQPWRIEFAALLSQLGVVWLPEDTVRKLNDGDDLDPSERGRAIESVATINRVLLNIPRLEPVTRLLEELKMLSLSDGPRTHLPSPEAGILKVAIDLDSLEARGLSLQESLKILRSEETTYGSETLVAVSRLKEDPERLQVQTVSVGSLAAGMVLCEDLKTTDGMLILWRGFEINDSSREHIMNFAGKLPDTVKVLAHGTQQSGQAVQASASA